MIVRLDNIATPNLAGMDAYLVEQGHSIRNSECLTVNTAPMENTVQLLEEYPYLLALTVRMENTLPLLQ